jgi:hypothetical protein
MLRNGSPRPRLDVGHAIKLQASHVPNRNTDVTAVFRGNPGSLLHEQKTNLLHLVFFFRIFVGSGVKIWMHLASESRLSGALLLPLTVRLWFNAYGTSRLGFR